MMNEAEVFIYKNLESYAVVAILSLESEWHDSNMRRPAPKAGALPAEPHPDVRQTYGNLRICSFVFCYVKPKLDAKCKSSHNNKRNDSKCGYAIHQDICDIAAPSEHDE